MRLMFEGVSWFTLSPSSINAKKCNGGYQLKGTEGFLQKAGVLTFLKTTTQLQIWFDDVLEVTWVYEDNDATNKCYMRNKMTGLSFRGNSKADTVCIQYRYETGNLAPGRNPGTCIIT